MKKIKTKKSKNGSTWNTFQVGDSKINTCTSKKGDVAIFYNGKKLNSKGVS